MSHATPSAAHRNLIMICSCRVQDVGQSQQFKLRQKVRNRYRLHQAGRLLLRQAYGLSWSVSELSPFLQTYLVYKHTWLLHKYCMVLVMFVLSSCKVILCSHHQIIRHLTFFTYQFHSTKTLDLDAVCFPMSRHGATSWGSRSTTLFERSEGRSL